uniref:Uncharacterized protein n=1 Tax=Candidatus Aramenus sulfurataquae TaxID=1326980 RepID=A0A0F2LPG9_9CREN
MPSLDESNLLALHNLINRCILFQAYFPQPLKNAFQPFLVLVIRNKTGQKRDRLTSSLNGEGLSSFIMASMTPIPILSRSIRKNNDTF